MELHDILNDSLVVTLAIVIGGAVSLWMKKPKILGFLFMGMLVGPNSIGLIGFDRLALIAELGAAFLLYEAALDFEARILLKAWRMFIVGGLVQTVLAVGIVTGLLLVLTPLPAKTAVFIGLFFSLASTAQALKLLELRSERGAAVGQIAIGLLLFQDVLVVPYSVGIDLLAGKDGNVWAMLKPVVLAITVIPALVIGVRYTLSRVYTWSVRHHDSEVYRGTIFAMIAVCCYCSHEIGLSVALGGFIAGIAAATNRNRTHLEHEVLPYKDVFGAAFFVVVGALFDLRVLLSHPFLVLGGVVFVVGSKVLVGSLSLAYFGNPRKAAVGAALLLGSVGEFSFVMANTAKTQGILDGETHKVVVAIAVLTMFVVVFLVSRRDWLDRLLGDRQYGNNRSAADFDYEVAVPKELAKHTIIVGWGPITTRALIPGLTSSDEPYSKVVIIEQGKENVRAARALGHHVLKGSSAVKRILVLAGVDRARLLIITPAPKNLKVTEETVAIARRLNPGLTIICRTQFKVEQDRLPGATIVVADDLAAGKLLVEETMRTLGKSDLLKFEVMELVTE